MYSDLSNEQARQLVDAEPVFAAYRAAERELNLRFAGSMHWRAVSIPS